MIILDEKRAWFYPSAYPSIKTEFEHELWPSETINQLLQGIEQHSCRPKCDRQDTRKRKQAKEIGLNAASLKQHRKWLSTYDLNPPTPTPETTHVWWKRSRLDFCPQFLVCSAVRAN